MADRLQPDHMAQLVWGAVKQQSLIEQLDAHDDMDWQYAMGPPPPRIVNESQLLQRLAPHIAARAPDLSVPAAVMAAWAYARSGRLEPGLMQRLGAGVTDRLHEFDLLATATLLWAFVKQRVWNKVGVDCGQLSPPPHSPMRLTRSYIISSVSPASWSTKSSLPAQHVSVPRDCMVPVAQLLLLPAQSNLRGLKRTIAAPLLVFLVESVSSSVCTLG
jgi:hypothetical protein